MTSHYDEEIDMTSPERIPSRPAPIAPPDSPPPFVSKVKASSYSHSAPPSSQPVYLAGAQGVDSRDAANEAMATAPQPQSQSHLVGSSTLQSSISLEVLEMIAAQQADAYHQKLREIAEHELRLQKWADSLHQKQEKLERWERRLGDQERDLAENTTKLRGGAGVADLSTVSFAERMNVFRRDSQRQHDEASAGLRGYSSHSYAVDDA
ncbi:Hypothetical protein, putative [Bodo saltans]|uniref:Uncharacterized protein n=1 Tax=Bodo saltans TaxID=75058 RepID=A0A0S4IJV8_BODSA|nr:Hypothetical protein, putative [Bodo saltans]|eukprot:CUE56553.1 Hypothetical protein, putative [Bodo saltans]